jgi:hypothetical protein
MLIKGDMCPSEKAGVLNQQSKLKELTSSNDQEAKLRNRGVYLGIETDEGEGGIATC